MSYEYHHYPPQPPAPLQVQAHGQSPNQDRSIPPIYNTLQMASLPPPQHQYYQTLQQASSPSFSPSGSDASSPMLSVNGVGTGNGTGIGPMAGISPHHQGQFQQQAQIHVQQPSPSTSSSQVSVTGNSSGSQLSVNAGAAGSMSSISPQHQGQYYPPSQEIKKPYTSPYNSSVGTSGSGAQIAVYGTGNDAGVGLQSMSSHPGQYQSQGQYYPQSQAVSPAASRQMPAVSGSGYGTASRTLSSISPQHGQHYGQQYGQQVQHITPASSGQMLAVNRNGGDLDFGLMTSISPQYQSLHFQQTQQTSPGVSDSQLSVNSGTGLRETSIISPQHQSPSYQQIQQALGPPPAFALPRSNSASPARRLFLSNQQQGQYQSLYQQLQTQSPVQTGQSLGAQDASSPIDENDVFTDVKAEVDEQTQQLWYWIEVVKVCVRTPLQR